MCTVGTDICKDMSQVSTTEFTEDFHEPGICSQRWEMQKQNLGSRWNRPPAQAERQDQDLKSRASYLRAKYIC